MFCWNTCFRRCWDLIFSIRLSITCIDVYRKSYIGMAFLYHVCIIHGNNVRRLVVETGDFIIATMNVKVSFKSDTVIFWVLLFNLFFLSISFFVNTYNYSPSYNPGVILIESSHYMSRSRNEFVGRARAVSYI